MRRKGEGSVCRKTLVDVKRMKKAAHYSWRDAEEMQKLKRLVSLRNRRTSTASSQSSKRSQMWAMDKYEPPKAAINVKNEQTGENEYDDEEARDRTLQYICRFFCNNGIPFDVVKSKSFKMMIEAIGQYGSDLKLPSYNEMRIPLLKKEVEYTNDLMRWNVENRAMFGCSIKWDGWSDGNKRGLNHFLVNTPHGSMFVRSVDASSYSKPEDRIWLLLNEFVEEMGEENVVQVVTDNGANFELAGKLLEVSRPKLFWTPCAAHCIDLMLRDIAKIPRVKDAIKKGIVLVSFIYNHVTAFNIMRRFTKKPHLVRSGITRSVTSFLTLQRLNCVKSSLEKMFTSEDWKSTKDATHPWGKIAEKNVLMPSFWKNVVFTLNAMRPLVKVLRLVLNEKKPAMGYIYEAMSSARKLIIENLDGDEKMLKKVLKIIDRRWECHLHHPLHVTGYYLNPEYYYRDSSVEQDAKVVAGFRLCVERLCATKEDIEKIYSQLQMYKNAAQSFGWEVAIRLRNSLPPGEWWANFGCSAPELRVFAVKVLNLTCSSYGCEQDWSTFEHIHSKQRNRLEQKKLQDLMFIKYNQTLKERFDSDDGRDSILLDSFSGDSDWVLGKIEADSDDVHDDYELLKAKGLYENEEDEDAYLGGESDNEEDKEFYTEEDTDEIDALSI